jgi:hypothetical protein
MSMLPFLSDSFENQIGALKQLVGEALTETIVPSIRKQHLTKDRAEKLLQLITEGQVFTAIQALPHFARANGSAADQLVGVIRRAVTSPRLEEATSGIIAVGNWANLDATANERSLPNGLVGLIVSAIETRRETILPALLHCALKLVEKQRIRKSDLKLICNSLDALAQETVYDVVDPASRTAVSLSIIRANCVQLANAIHSRGHHDGALKKWLDLAQNDPLPEVRYALTLPT